MSGFRAHELSGRISAKRSLSVSSLGLESPDLLFEARTAKSYATAPRPFFATSVNNFSEVPRGRFSPRSHWLTSPVVTLR